MAFISCRGGAQEMRDKAALGLLAQPALTWIFLDGSLADDLACWFLDVWFGVNQHLNSALKPTYRHESDVRHS
jgi:hypothetical protein